MSIIGKSMETESTLVVGRVWGWVEWGMTASGHEVSFWDDENILELDSGDCCTTL